MTQYITGALQPADLESQQRDFDTESASLDDTDTGEEDDTDDALDAPVFSPSLDPKSRPAVAGLSFRVRTIDGQAPQLNLCVTWGRYTSPQPERGKKSSGPRVWQRQPRYWCSEQPIALTATQDLRLDGTATTQATKETQEVSLHLRASLEPDGQNTYRVQIQLVNRIKPAQPQGALDAGECIFQPSVRIKLEPGSELQPMRAHQINDEEEKRLEFLFQERPSLARGHFCSAVWHDVDPERPLDGKTPASLTWADAEIVPDLAREQFTAPDVRTEFIPAYAIQAPSWDWEPQWGPAPEMRAEELSEHADAATMIAALEPLITGYQKWVEQLEKQSTDQVSQGLADEARALLERMKRGLEVLSTNSDARIAFCFANRAMWLQSSWQKRPMIWRSFQLGFFLAILESVVHPDSADRQICDLLWVPTGGGKTEAYLAIAAFTLAYRRRTALKRKSGNRSGAGTTVFTRYTLRLLTLQQFRRALAMVTACEYLRVAGLGSSPAGWRPQDCGITDELIWGSTRFSIGMWVGGDVTPNKLQDYFPTNSKGAISNLRGYPGKGEPAQVLTCPACGATLALPGKELTPGKHRLHLVGKLAANQQQQLAAALQRSDAPKVTQHSLSSMDSTGFSVLMLELEVKDQIRHYDLNSKWWAEGPGTIFKLEALSFSRPGYFPRNRNGTAQAIDFEIWCPSPECRLGDTHWSEGTPSDDHNFQNANGRKDAIAGGYKQVNLNGRRIPYPDNLYARRVINPWQTADNTFVASRVPIPAITVDEQVYAHPPSVLVATVDKFARMSFEPRAGLLFGNAKSYHPWEGYVRHRSDLDKTSYAALAVDVDLLDPPELIIQDELHLVEGPLGSMVGLYEMAVDYLASREGKHTVKYIASTATVREAGSQVRALFNRDLAMFPPRGHSVNDRFFLRVTEPHPLDESRPGQLYVGVTAPGTGPLKPVYRLWSILLQAVQTHATHPDIDYFKTLAGYFNAVRELAGARALTRQDIPLHLKMLAQSRGEPPRMLNEDEIEELSSRCNSTELPTILEKIGQKDGSAPTALLATSMFGTGVDISRLSLMLVHGQPKTTSSYIQAAGRVGRERAALVVTFLRASRPRDLSHYEYFNGYHRQIYRHVEPITVMPFSPRALDLAGGPVMVAMLRGGLNTDWRKTARQSISNVPASMANLQALPGLLEERAQAQPELRRPNIDEVRDLAASEIDRWKQLARLHTDLAYAEYDESPTLPVVLGDLRHEGRNLPTVFENAPQSLREIEATIGVATTDPYGST